MEGDGHDWCERWRAFMARVAVCNDPNLPQAKSFLSLQHMVTGARGGGLDGWKGMGMTGVRGAGRLWLG